MNVVNQPSHPKYYAANWDEGKCRNVFLFWAGVLLLIYLIAIHTPLNESRWFFVAIVSNKLKWGRENKLAAWKIRNPVMPGRNIYIFFILLFNLMFLFFWILNFWTESLFFFWGGGGISSFNKKKEATTWQ